MSLNVICLGVVLGDISPILCFLSFLDFDLMSDISLGKFSVIIVSNLFHFFSLFLPLLVFPYMHVTLFVAVSQFLGVLISSFFSPFQFQKFLLSHPEAQSFLSPVQSTNEPTKAFFISLKKKKKIYLFLGVLVIPMFLLLLRLQSHEEGREGWHPTWTLTESRWLVCWEQTTGSERQKWAEAAATAVFQMEVARGQSRLHFEERYENNCPVTGDAV